MDYAVPTREAVVLPEAGGEVPPKCASEAEACVLAAFLERRLDECRV